MRKSIRLLCVIGVLGLAACGPKNSDLLNQNKAFSATLMIQSRGVAESIASMPLIPESRCTPPTKLTYAPKSDAHDTDFVMYDAIEGIGRASEEEKSELDFHLSEGLIPSYLVWIDPANKYYLGKAEKASATATPLLRDTFRRVKNLKYLVVIKPRPIEREAGELIIDTYLADLKGTKALCAFTITARADPKLGVEHYNVVERNRKTGKERVVRSGSRDNFHSALWQDARKQVFAEVKKQLELDTPQ